MAADVAPGLKRDYFGFLGWLGHDPALWENLLEDARKRAEAGLRALPAKFHGNDQDPQVLNEARRNAQQAGVVGFLHLERHSIEHLHKPADSGDHGLLICNPPYGERIGQHEALAPTYRALGDRAREEFSGWRLAVITSDEDLGRAIGLRRIEGQVRGLQRLIEDDNDCVDVLTQVSATTRALESFAIQLVEQHLQACVREASQDGVDPEAKVMEITAAIARLVRS